MLGAVGSSVLFVFVRFEFTCCWTCIVFHLSFLPLSGLQSVRVMETCKQSDKMMEEYQERLNSKLSRKFEIYEENRRSQLQNMMKRLRDHVSCPAS